MLATIDPLAAMAGADVAKLDAVLREATATTPGVQELLAEIADDAGLYKDDEQEEDDSEPQKPHAEPITRPGDVWILGEHKLTCGDSEPRECDVVAAAWEKLTGRRAILERSPHPPEHAK